MAISPTVSHTLAALQERHKKAALTRQEAASECGIGVSTLDRYVKEGNGPRYVRIGKGRGRVMFRLEDIAAFIDASVAA